MRQYETYRCDACGNEVEVQKVGGGTLTCCNARMINITDNLTLVNLLKAFSGESQARNRYEYFAKIAQNEGHRDIAEHFQRAANNEKTHAKEELKLHNKIKLGKEFADTAANLKAAIVGENYENISMYPEFAKIAKDEGQNEAAALFKNIAKVEIEHENMYKELLGRLCSGNEFLSDNEEEDWICEKCGNIHRGKNAPEICPLCKHPQEYQSRLNSKK